MISGLDLKATIDYTLKNDTTNPTIWKLGVIPSDLFSRISQEAQTDQMGTVFKIVQATIKGWSNFQISGTDCPYSTEKQKVFGEDMDIVPMSLIRQIPLNVITELSTKAMEINQLSELETKN